MAGIDYESDYIYDYDGSEYDPEEGAALITALSEPTHIVRGGVDPMAKTWRLLPYAGIGVLSVIVFIASVRFEPKLWLGWIAAGGMLLFRYRAAVVDYPKGRGK